MKTAPGAYALRGCWKLFFDNKDIYFEQPHRVFWHKDGYYDWNECIKRKANMENFKKSSRSLNFFMWYSLPARLYCGCHYNRWELLGPCEPAFTILDWNQRQSSPVH